MPILNRVEDSFSLEPLPVNRKAFGTHAELIPNLTDLCLSAHGYNAEHPLVCLGEL